MESINKFLKHFTSPHKVIFFRNIWIFLFSIFSVSIFKLQVLETVN